MDEIIVGGELMETSSRMAFDAVSSLRLADSNK
jgi:hypothetical protein